MKFFKKLSTSFKERGVRDTLRQIDIKIRILADRMFDHKFKVDTSGISDVEDISFEQKSLGFHYEPTPVPALKVMLKMLCIDHFRYTFIDFGSGKGRVLLLASEYPYRRIIGVEISENLHIIAKSNIKTWNNPRQKCFNLESICMDARDFKLPNDPLVLFFFTPFRTTVISQVANNIEESLRDSPRPIQILYYGSNEEFINILGKLNVTRQEIYDRRPFSARKKFKGLLFSRDG